MKHMHKNALIALVAAAALAGCGGGGGNGGDSNPNAEDPSKVPASAAGSTAAWFKFASGLAPMEAETPLAMDAIAGAPESDTEEPQALP